MKIRQGFVSNSSTSSFVIVGYKIKCDKFDDKNFLDKVLNMNISNMDEDEISEALYDSNKIICDEEFCYIGTVLFETDSDDYYIPSKEIELSKINTNEIKQIGEKLNITDEIKIFSGTRSS